MATSTRKSQSPAKRFKPQLSGAANRELLNLYLNEVAKGTTFAARHLLELHRQDLRQQISPENLLDLYIYRVLGHIIDIKDSRDEQRARTGKGGSEATYYREIVRALNLIEPKGRPGRKWHAIDKGTAAAQRMNDGLSLEDAAHEAEKRDKTSGSKDAYSRYKTASKANLALKKLATKK